MTLIISAANVHTGGGRTLLLALIAATKVETVALIDARLDLPPDLPSNLKTIVVRPTIAARFAAERSLPSLAVAGDTLIAFGNLPPLFANPAKVHVYIQNRYLTSSQPLTGLPLRARLRIMVERLWLRSCLRNATILVQTPSTAAEVKTSLRRNAIVAPFAPLLEAAGAVGGTKFDFVYAASGEPHKNHRRLIEAWTLLAGEGHRPSLRLTLDPAREPELSRWIDEQIQRHSLKVTNTQVTPDGMAALYSASAALIYPSIFESFGLPLIEANRAGLPIVSAERDYVRDVVSPAQTFDPESTISIARAVKRHLRLNSEAIEVPSAAGFLAKLLGFA